MSSWCRHEFGAWQPQDSWLWLCWIAFQGNFLNLHYLRLWLCWIVFQGNFLNHHYLRARKQATFQKVMQYIWPRSCCCKISVIYCWLCCLGGKLLASGFQRIWHSTCHRCVGDICVATMQHSVCHAFGAWQRAPLQQIYVKQCGCVCPVLFRFWATWGTVQS